jgi:hypothetical protein
MLQLFAFENAFSKLKALLHTGTVEVLWSAGVSVRGRAPCQVKRGIENYYGWR